MCGIVGYAQTPACPASLEGHAVLEAMTGALSHRGPDAEGYRHEPGRLAMGHRRLVVIDRAGGAQPMHDPERGLTVVFNGEIYNYLELNAELSQRGYQARTRSDTETLLLAFSAWGEACTAKLNGMFSFVIHDANAGEAGRLFGVRDRLGKKPLYYVHTGPFLAFASEPKALLKHPRVSRELDLHAAARYLIHEFVPAPYAIYRGMRKLPAGSCFSFDLATGDFKVKPYWDHRFPLDETPLKDGPRGEGEWGRQIRAGLERAVQRRLISDVPLGVFLSGGIDSSAITATMVKLQGRGHVKTFSIGFNDTSFDETAHARQLATQLGTEHHEERLSPEAALEILPTVCAFLDEPFADPSVLPTYLLSRFTRKYVTVALGGDGGDELFAGYDTFKALKWARFYNAIVPHPVHKNLLHPLAQRLPVDYGNFSFDFKVKQFMRGLKANESERLWRWMGAFAAEEVAALLTPEALETLADDDLYDELHHLGAAVAHQDAITRDSYMLAKTYLADGVLAKVDRATMACSLEARSPLLDIDFVELANTIPGSFKYRRGRLKHIFKQALQGLVPETILNRPKKGFGIPVATWFRGPLKEILLDTLNEKSLREGGLFRPRAVEALVANHLAGKANHRKPLWALFMFERWRSQWG